MVMSWIWTGMVALSVFAALVTGRGGPLAAATSQGAKAAVELTLALGGSLCLWSAVGRLLEKSGITPFLARVLRPVLFRVFPTSRKNPELSSALTGNICANFLGLGNAATPMGIRAAQLLAGNTGVACNELCRLVVLNTASIQAIPATVAALRASYGCATPFDILPAVWVTSLLSAGAGLAAAWVLGKVWKA